MRSTETSLAKLAEIDARSLEKHDLKFLMNEGLDRSAYDMAMKAIEPLAELDDIIDRGTKMPRTQAAIRQCIRNVNDAITSDPDPILNALNLSDTQKKLVDSITACEVLKFSMLNAFDAVRMNFITDFRKELKFYTDEVISYTVVGSTAGGLRLLNPQRAPFSKVKEMTSYDIIHRGASFMIIGPESSAAGGSVVLRVPGTSLGLPLDNVSPGKIYVAGRNSDDEPAPIANGHKALFLGVTPPARGMLDDTIESISNRPGRDFDLVSVARSNFRVPAPAEGMLVSIYRAIRGRTAFKPPGITADEFVEDLKIVTLSDFKKYFEALVTKTEGATGDIVSYDIADTLFFAGLASVGGMLGISRPAGSAPGGGSTSGGTGEDPGDGSASGGGSGASRGAGRVIVRHSLRNVLTNPMIAAGATPAERSANLAKISSAINQDELRTTLNRLTNGSVVFTEGTVDRWCELAGIKESR